MTLDTSARTSCADSPPLKLKPSSVIEAWAEGEFLPWRGWEAGQGGLSTQLDEYVHFHPGVFRFSIRNGLVRFHTKSGDLLERHYPPGSDFATIEARGHAYQAFMQSVIETFDIPGEADLAICLDDLSHHASGLPILSFQKKIGSSNILIPDVDFIDFKFYIDDQYNDPWPFGSKLKEAIFVGSTTGFQPIDHRMVAALDHQRLRSAVHFRDHPLIHYELPVITQCDGPETEQMIRDLGLGTIRRTWAEQLRRRYIISVDGNGATCSRVAIALRSKSVLIKYESQNQLYYFSSLRPFENYISVSSDEDVLHVVDMLNRSPTLAEAIADESQEFYKRHLSRIAVMTFTARILSRYIRQFGSAFEGPPGRRSRFVIDSYAHVANIGDVWAEPRGWAGDRINSIEGFELQVGPDIDPQDVRCRTIGADGSLSDDIPAGAFCGTRGQGKSLTGFSIDLRGAAADQLDLTYEGVFADGTLTGPLSSGTVCSANAPLTAFRLTTTDRRNAP